MQHSDTLHHVLGDARVSSPTSLFCAMGRLHRGLLTYAPLEVETRPRFATDTRWYRGSHAEIGTPKTPPLRQASPSESPGMR